MFDVDGYLERYLPPTLLQGENDKIKEGLRQFFPEHRTGKVQYSGFYLASSVSYFMQGDLIDSLPIVYWNYDANRYETAFSPVMLVSNSCDVSAENQRISQKEALFAQIVSLDDYVHDLTEAGANEETITSILSEIRNQKISNLFYLPPSHLSTKEFLVFFDKICWHPADIFVKKLERINDERNLSLSNWGYYLLIFKLSLHFCRVPEDVERLDKAVA